MPLGFCPTYCANPALHHHAWQIKKSADPPFAGIRRWCVVVGFENGRAALLLLSFTNVPWVGESSLLLFNGCVPGFLGTERHARSHAVALWVFALARLIEEPIRLRDTVVICMPWEIHFRSRDVGVIPLRVLATIRLAILTEAGIQHHEMKLAAIERIVRLLLFHTIEELGLGESVHAVVANDVMAILRGR